MLRVSQPDDLLQYILWTECPNEYIRVYKLNFVTYGTKPEAFLAICSKQRLAKDKAAKILMRDFYVDDLISGGDTINEVHDILHEVLNLLEKGNSIIRKWSSNNVNVLNGIPSDQHENLLKFHDSTDVTKTLGLVWDPSIDNFIFLFLSLENKETTTKRFRLLLLAFMTHWT